MATYDESKRRMELYNRRKRSRLRRNLQMLKRGIAFACFAFITILLIIKFLPYINSNKEVNVTDVFKVMEAKKEIILPEPEYDVQLLTPNEYSRPQTALSKVKGIVIHYTANPGTTAQQNRDYFEGLKKSGHTKVSSHFVIGLDGEIIQCIPSKEMSYASNERNIDTLSIECCHPDQEGKFTGSTYSSLVELSAWLLVRFDLTVNDLLRHYDITGKACPLYFVEHEDEWTAFKMDVQKYIDRNGIEK